MDKKKKKGEIDPAILMSYLYEETSLQPPPSAYVPFEKIDSPLDSITFFDKPGMEPSQIPAAPIGEELNRIVTKEELAQILKVSPGYIDKLRRMGKIPYIQEKVNRTGGQRIPIRFNLKEVLEALRRDASLEKQIFRSGRRARGRGE